MSMKPLDDLSAWMHDHVFDAGSQRAERGTWWVVGITAVMMVGEILAGWWFNSMALLADGWHMSSHVVAIGLSALAYATARRYAGDPRFAFGTWKVEILAGFASAVFLLVVALLMAIGSLERLWSPEPIRFREAMVVAVLGLLVNLACAWILAQVHDHGHDHGHGHDHHHGHGQVQARSHDDHEHAAAPAQDGEGHRHQDLNLRSAYLHVLTDAATSVLAVLALLGGWLWGWNWLDPVMGLVGAVVVALWAKGLVIDTAKVLLDREMDAPVVQEVREAVESDGGRTRITDLHVWRVGRHAYSCALTAVTNDGALTPADLRERLAVHEEIVHATIELHHTGRGAA